MIYGYTSGIESNIHQIRDILIAFNSNFITK